MVPNNTPFRILPRVTAVSAVLLVLVTGTAYAQTAPTVSNVRAAPRGDALSASVFVPACLRAFLPRTHDLAHNAACTVWPVLSGDGDARC